jgi:ribosome-dependent ATPase
MHAAKFLAVGPAKWLSEGGGKDNLGDAFIAYLEDAAGSESKRLSNRPGRQQLEPLYPPRCDLRRLWAYARQATMEILCDPIRLAFSFLDPLILMLTVG